MKVLITTDSYFPIISGVVTSVSNLYKELKSQGHEIKILTLSHNGVERIEGDVYYLKSIGIGVYPGARIKVPFHNKLVNEIINWKPDIIHSQTEFSTMLVSKYISKHLDIPLVHTYHTMYEDYLGYLFRGKLINKSRAGKLTKMLLNTVDGVIVPSEKARKALHNYGVKKPISIIPTGINIKHFQKKLSADEKERITSNLGLTREDRVIAYVGRIAEEKNISEVVALFKDTINFNKNVKLLIVGGGPYLEKIQEQVKEESLENRVIFTGMVDPNEVYKYYKIAEIFVTASTSETQGLTYLEALSSGCPIVCKYDSCIDGFVEQGSNGFTYTEKKEFPYYINKILQDDCLRAKMRNEAVNKANEHSSSIFANRILEIYFNILKGEERVITLERLTDPKV